MSKNTYAIELTTLATSKTNAVYGLLNGVFRFVTGSPSYDGVTIIPKWAQYEIDNSGNYRITGGAQGDNTNTYYENILTADWCVGNPIRQCDFSLQMNYDTSASFSFKIRGDKISTYFWDYCQANGIVLSNAIVRFYIVIENIFYSQWRGIVSKTSSTDQDFTFECSDEGTVLHKIIPPDTVSIVTTTTTAQTTVQDNVTNANTSVVNDIVPASNQQISQEVIPVVFGNVPFSPLMKFSDQNTFVSWWTNVTGFIGITPVNLSDVVLTSAWEYNTTIPNVTPAHTIQDTLGVYHISALLLYSPAPAYPDEIYGALTFKENTFVRNDPRLVGKYIMVMAGTNADTEQAYKITGNEISSLTTFNDTLGNTISFHSTTIYFEEGLLDSNGDIVSQANFSANNYWFNMAPAAGQPLSASDSTWWFKISDFNVATALSTINYDGGPYNLPKAVFGATAQNKNDTLGNDTGLIQLFEYDSNTKSYIDISDCCDTQSTGQSLILKCNTMSSDGKIQHLEDIGFPIEFYGIRFGVGGNPLDFTSSPPTYPSNKVPYEHSGNYSIPLITNKQQNSAASSTIWDLTYLNGLNTIYFIYARFRVQPLSVSYDKIYFLSDFRLQMTLGSQQYVIGGLRYSLFDNSGRIIQVGSSWSKASLTQLPQHVTGITWPFSLSSGTPVDWHLIPSNFFTDLLSGYIPGLFAAAAPYEITGKYTWKSFFDFDSPSPNPAFTPALSKDDVSKSNVGFIECYIPIGADSPTGWGNLQVIIKQLTLMGVRMIDTIKGDLYVRAQGEATDKSEIYSPGSGPSFNSQGQLMTNSVYGAFSHILEDYDQIPYGMIDYDFDNASNYGLYTKRNLSAGWMVGRTLVDQKNSTDYFNELCAQSFTAMFQNRHGQRALRGFDPGITTQTVATGKTQTHDNSLIVEGSISDFSKTDWTQTYNSFNLGYGYDPGLKGFTKFFTIAHVDDSRGFPTPSRTGTLGISVAPSGYTLAGLLLHYSLTTGNLFYTDGNDTTGVDLLAAKQLYFPSATLSAGDSFIVTNTGGVFYYGPDIYNRDWTTYVSGAGITYTSAQVLWAPCHYQWTQNKIVKLASSDVSDLYWFIDSTSYDASDNSSSGTASSAFMLLELLAGSLTGTPPGGGNHVIGWSIYQKDVVTYSIPITANTFATEIMDCLKFNDVVFTNGTDRTGWVMSVETDAANDQFIIKVVMLPVGQ